MTRAGTYVLRLGDPLSRGNAHITDERDPNFDGPLRRRSPECLHAGPREHP